MKYEVQLENYAPLFATVIVYADSPEEAEGKAMQMDYEGLIAWETPEFACYSGTAVVLEDYQEVTDHDEIASIESFYEFANDWNTITFGQLQHSIQPDNENDTTPT